METNDEIKRELLRIRPQLNREIKFMIVPPKTRLYMIGVMRHYTNMANVMYENGYCN